MIRLTRAAVCGWLFVAAACSRSVDFDRMRQQRRADPYASTPVFADRMTLRVPPTGAVPAERVTAAADGRHQFEVFCAVCHGPDASGRSVMASNITVDPPPSLVTGDAVQHSDREWLEVISHGRKRMPAYDWALSADERTAVIAYIRTLGPPAAEESPR